MSRENLLASANRPVPDHSGAQGASQPPLTRAPLTCTGHMPRVLRMPVVTGRTGLSRSHIYVKIKSGEFPAQFVLGTRAVG